MGRLQCWCSHEGVLTSPVSITSTIQQQRYHSMFVSDTPTPLSMDRERLINTQHYDLFNRNPPLGPLEAHPPPTSPLRLLLRQHPPPLVPPVPNIQSIHHHQLLTRHEKPPNLPSRIPPRASPPRRHVLLHKATRAGRAAR